MLKMSMKAFKQPAKSVQCDGVVVVSIAFNLQCTVICEMEDPAKTISFMASYDTQQTEEITDMHLSIQSSL